VGAAYEREGRPYLWVLEAPFTREEDDEPLDAPPLPCQLAQAQSPHFLQLTWKELIAEEILRLSAPPRWLFFLAGQELTRVDRHKWGQGRRLRFNWTELLGRKEPRTLNLAAALLHREALWQEGSASLLEQLTNLRHPCAARLEEDWPYRNGCHAASC
jgi:hypothetical protein